MKTGIHSANSELDRPAAILMIAAPGRRQDNLRAILRSVPDSLEVLCAATPGEAETHLSRRQAALVLIDHTLTGEQIYSAIRLVRRLSNQARILLLAAHPRDAYRYEDPRPDAILCEGFSGSDLVAEIQKAKTFQTRSEPGAE